MVRGFQGDNLSDNDAIAACVKHFVGYGASEGGRDYNSTNIPERLLRNVYLPPFQKTVEAGAATLMTSFNDNDGVPASGNDFLLRTVLRDEWGFDGFVVSDWCSMVEMINHGFAADRKDVARLSANAGLDMEMVSQTYVDYLPELIAENKVSIDVIDNAVRNILRIKYRLGLFENPYVDEVETSTIYSDEHLQTARQAATESAILLKNNGVLLPAHNKTVAIIGPMAHAPYDQLGTWSSDDMTKPHRNSVESLAKRRIQTHKILLRGRAGSFEREQSAISKGKSTPAPGPMWLLSLSAKRLSCRERLTR